MKNTWNHKYNGTPNNVMFPTLHSRIKIFTKEEIAELNKELKKDCKAVTRARLNKDIVDIEVISTRGNINV